MYMWVQYKTVLSYLFTCAYSISRITLLSSWRTNLPMHILFLLVYCAIFLLIRLLELLATILSHLLSSECWAQPMAAASVALAHAEGQHGARCLTNWRTRTPLVSTTRNCAGSCRRTTMAPHFGPSFCSEVAYYVLGVDVWSFYICWHWTTPLGCKWCVSVCA